MCPIVVALGTRRIGKKTFKWLSFFEIDAGVLHLNDNIYTLF